MEVCDAVDSPSTVTGVGHSVQTHLTHGTVEAAGMVGVAQRFQNLWKRERAISSVVYPKTRKCMWNISNWLWLYGRDREYFNGVGIHGRLWQINLTLVAG